MILLAVNPLGSQQDFVWHRPLVGSVFAAICLLGILAVLFPDACSRFFVSGSQKNVARSRVFHGAGSTLIGHHPQCGGYSGHVFTVGQKVFCAACSGLFIGALLALVGIGVFFFGGWRIAQSAAVIVVVGVVGVALGLLQSPLPVLQKSSVVRLFTSVFFVVGAFLILLGIEELAHNVSLDLFVVALSVFWLVTRISFSSWDHERICFRCRSESCGFKRDLGKKDF